MNQRLALEKDVGRRVARFQAMLKENNLGALLVVSAGGPGLSGMCKYLTNWVAWSGRAWVVLGEDSVEPALLMTSSYGAKWNEQEATTQWIEFDMRDVIGRAVAVLKEMAGPNKRVGVESVATGWTMGEWERVCRELPDFEFVDVTKEVLAMRAIKTPFEVMHITEMGAMMVTGLAAFEEAARLGVNCWKAGAAAEEAMRAVGCIWGRQKFSMDLRPYTIPTALDRRFTVDDIYVFELVYCSPLGYWCEISNLYSYNPLPVRLQTQLETQSRVIEACAYTACPGNPIGLIAETSARLWAEAGYTVVGKHTPDCHCIGLDENDGISAWYTPNELLQQNMVLSFHPSAMLDGERAFLLSDNYLVTMTGATRLSPKNWYHRQLPG